jgi:hypothetical protein
MAKRRNTNVFDQLHAQGLRKRVARAVADLESGGKKAGAGAEKTAREALANLRALTAELEKRLGSSASTSRRAGARKAAATRKRAAAKRSGAAKKAAATRKRSSSASKTSGGARKSPARKTARKAVKKTTSRARKR